MHHRKHTIHVLLLIFMALLVTACQSQEETPQEFTIGVINLGPVLDPIYEGFKDGLSELGYVEGENITYIYNGPVGNIDGLGAEAQVLLDADVDLILALSTPAVIALQQIEGEIPPVIFAPIFDPIAANLVPSLSKPGGTFTGVYWGLSEEQRLSWLLRLAPGVERIYIPYNPEDPAPSQALAKVTEAADKFGVELLLREAPNPDAITAAIAEIPDNADAIMLMPDNLVASRADEFVAAAFERNLPLTIPTDAAVEAGALVNYSFRFHDVGVQSARLADQIMKGIDPADLPIETAEFFLTINLKTAEALGLDVSDEALEAADTIIR